MLHDNMDYTPYEGLTVTGWPRTVINRGSVIVDCETLLVERGAGQFLERVPANADDTPSASWPLAPSQTFGADLS